MGPDRRAAARVVESLYDQKGQDFLCELSAIAAGIGEPACCLPGLSRAGAGVASTVQSLQEQLAAARKDSSTSSKPPSSDIVKPPRPAPAADDSPRAPGGQVGHAKHERAPFPPEQV